MAKTKKSFIRFATGWALGIAFCSVCNRFIICGLMDGYFDGVLRYLKGQ